MIVSLYTLQISCQSPASPYILQTYHLEILPVYSNGDQIRLLYNYYFSLGTFLLSRYRGQKKRPYCTGNQHFDLFRINHYKAFPINNFLNYYFFKTCFFTKFNQLLRLKFFKSFFRIRKFI